MVYLLSTRRVCAFLCAQKIPEQSHQAAGQHSTGIAGCGTSVGLYSATTTMALLKPPTPGECFCGKTRISLIDADAIVSSSICHCSVCRRLCGAPFCANLLTPRSNVRIDIYGSPASVDALAGLQTSKNVVRYRCTSCSSPTLATLKLGKQDLYALPLAAFPRPHPAKWAPQHHFHYSDRVMDVRDGLTKYSGRYLLSDECDDAGEPLPKGRLPGVGEEGALY